MGDWREAMKLECLHISDQMGGGINQHRYGDEQ